MILVVIMAMVIAVVIMIVAVTVLPTAVTLAEIDDDCRFTVAVAVPPMATDLDDAAADLRCLDPGTGNCIRRNGKNNSQSECR